MVGSDGGFPWGHMYPRLWKGVRGSTFLLVTGHEWGPSSGSSVDRTDAVWSGQCPEPGQRGSGLTGHRNGGSRLEQVASEGGRSWSWAGPMSKARTLMQTSRDPEGGPESPCMG